MSKGLSKYIAALNYINQPLSIDKGVSIASFVCAVVALVEQQVQVLVLCFQQVQDRKEAVEINTE